MGKPDKPIKPNEKQNCFSKVFYGKHIFNYFNVFNLNIWLILTISAES